jgi:hypothetical protein
VKSDKSLSYYREKIKSKSKGKDPLAFAQ